MRQAYLIVKRILDFVFAVVMLVILLPLFAVAAVAIRLDSPGPVLFRQDRRGVGGEVFTIYKFRSMVMGAEKSGTGVYTYQGDARVTKMGNFIRKTSIDELPQLFNIIKGDMSFIGPRPTLTYHPWPIEEYTQEQLRRFTIRPGVTGWAQVNGRKDVPWDKRMVMDVWYVDHLNPLLDLKIMFMTFTKVIFAKDNVNVSETAVKSADKKD